MEGESLGSRIRRLRLEQGISQEALALRIGCPGHANISRYESGSRVPSMESIDKLANALGVTRRYLLTGANAPTHESTAERLTIRGRTKTRTTIQVYPETANTIKRLARQHGITIPEITEQFVQFCLRSLDS